jgi:hypothetical protein
VARWRAEAADRKLILHADNSGLHMAAASQECMEENRITELLTYFTDPRWHLQTFISSAV